MSFDELAKKRLARAVGVDVSSVNEVAARFTEGVVNFLCLILGRAPSPIFAKSHRAERELRNAQAGISE